MASEQQADVARLSRAVKTSGIVICLGIVVVAIAFFIAQRETSTPTLTETTVSKSVVPQVAGIVPPISFTDVTEASGITFVHENGATGDRLLPETMGGGVAVFDFDLDDDLDLLFVNSTEWQQVSASGSEIARSALYANDGEAQFTDVTASHLDLVTYGMAPAIGDINGDRFPDLFVTAVGSNRLFLNDNGKRFVDVTERYGVAGNADEFSSCATFFDYDRDGDLDLFVCNYVAWSVEIDQAVNFQLTGVGRAYGPPTDFPGSNSRLYRNDGERFQDVTASAGIAVFHEQTGEPMGKALAVSVTDVNVDGWPDLIVANDTVRNFLFINQLDGTFSESGMELGVAFDASGSATGAMGLDVANYNNDDRLGVAIGNFANEMSSFYVRSGTSNVFSDDAIVLGIGAYTRKVLTFGLFFFDVDNDGRLDLFSANGHIEPEIATVQASQSYEQPSQLFWNCGTACTRKFQPVDSIGTALAQTSVGRGAVYGDFDGDGDLDIVVTNVNDKVRLLRNDLDSSNSWINVRLTYQDANQHGIGSTIRIAQADSTLSRLMTRTRSYLSQFDASAHFGIANSPGLHRIEVEWPNGKTERFDGVASNQSVTLRIGGGLPIE